MFELKLGIDEIKPVAGLCFILSVSVIYKHLM
jgi:hypothetical protein